MNDDATTKTNGKNKPAHKIRLGGLSATIWESAFDEGKTSYRAYLSKSYRDNKGAWQESTTFRPDDLILVSDLARRAAEWILAREAE